MDKLRRELIRSEGEVVFAHPREHLLVDLLPGDPALLQARDLAGLQEVPLGRLDLLLAGLREVVARDRLELGDEPAVGDLGVLDLGDLVVDGEGVLGLLGLLDLGEDVLGLLLDDGEGVGVVDVLLLDPEEVPDAPAQDLQQPRHQREHRRLGDQLDDRGGYREGPGAPQHQVQHHHRVVVGRLLVAEVVPQEGVLGALLQQPPVVLLNSGSRTRSQ